MQSILAEYTRSMNGLTCVSRYGHYIVNLKLQALVQTLIAILQSADGRELAPPDAGVLSSRSDTKPRENLFICHLQFV